MNAGESINPEEMQIQTYNLMATQREEAMTAVAYYCIINEFVIPRFEKFKLLQPGDNLSIS